MVAGRPGWVLALIGAMAAGLLVAPAAHAADDDLPPPRQRKERWEVGAVADMLFISRFHNLKAPGSEQYEYRWPAVLLGARAGYFPERYLGFEAEAAVGTGAVGERVSSSRRFRGPDLSEPPLFVPVRAHALLQFPLARVVPFALVGAGAIVVNSTQMGSDVDALLDFGIGAKYFATKRIVPRLDLRLDMTQREDGSLSDGIALHGEVAFSVGFVL